MGPDGSAAVAIVGRTTFSCAARSVQFARKGLNSAIGQSRRTNRRPCRQNPFSSERHKREIAILPPLKRRVGSYRRCNCDGGEYRQQPIFEASGPRNHRPLSVHWRFGSHAPLGRRFNGSETRQPEAGGAAQEGLWGVASASTTEPPLRSVFRPIAFASVAVALRYKRNQLRNQLASPMKDVRPP